MTKIVAALGFAVLALSSVEGLRGPCDLKLLEKKAWCGTCVAYVPRAQVKAGVCPKDKERVDILDVCVKTFYVAACHPTTTGLKPLSCCGVTYDKPTEDLAKVFWNCEGCKEKSKIRDFKHPDTCTARKVVKACEKSGTAPHSAVGK